MIARQELTGVQPVPVKARTLARFADVDNLRIYLTLLVIFHHAAIAYGGAGDWGVKDQVTDEISPIILSIFNGINQAYFMAAFFLLAGYFTPAALERKGARQFLLDRLIRLGIPLLVYTTLIVNLNGYLLDRFYYGVPYQVRVGYNPGHLWFLQALLLFAVVYLLWQGLKGGNGASQARQETRPFPADRVLWGWIAGLALLTFAMRLFFPVGVWFLGVQPGHFVHYVFAFSAGIVAYRNGWLDRLPPTQTRRWGIGVWVGIPLFVVIGVAAGALEDPTVLTRLMGGWYWEALMYATWESFFLVAALIFLLHLFRTRFNQAGPLLTFLAANVYTVYIIHQTILYAANIGLLGVDLPSIVKFFVAAIVTVPICFGLSALIRRLPGATRVLG
jgi:surface polysaccharide O-acyltransferase-like enzyme